MSVHCSVTPPAVLGVRRGCPRAVVRQSILLHEVDVDTLYYSLELLANKDYTYLRNEAVRAPALQRYSSQRAGAHS